MGIGEIKQIIEEKRQEYLKLIRRFKINHQRIKKGLPPVLPEEEKKVTTGGLLSSFLDQAKENGGVIRIKKTLPPPPPVELSEESSSSEGYYFDFDPQNIDFNCDYTTETSEESSCGCSLRRCRCHFQAQNNFHKVTQPLFSLPQFNNQPLNPCQKTVNFPRIIQPINNNPNFCQNSYPEGRKSAIGFLNCNNINQSSCHKGGTDNYQKKNRKGDCDRKKNNKKKKKIDKKKFKCGKNKCKITPKKRNNKRKRRKSSEKKSISSSFGYSDESEEEDEEDEYTTTTTESQEETSGTSSSEYSKTDKYATGDSCCTCTSESDSGNSDCVYCRNQFMMNNNNHSQQLNFGRNSQVYNNNNLLIQTHQVPPMRVIDPNQNINFYNQRNNFQHNRIISKNRLPCDNFGDKLIPVNISPMRLSNPKYNENFLPMREKSEQCRFNNYNNGGFSRDNYYQRRFNEERFSPVKGNGYHNSPQINNFYQRSDNYGGCRNRH